MRGVGRRRRLLLVCNTTQLLKLSELRRLIGREGLGVMRAQGSAADDEQLLQWAADDGALKS